MFGQTVNRVSPPARDEVRITAVSQTRIGPVYQLRGGVTIETADMILRADEIDYNEETGAAEARGHVFFQHFPDGEQLRAERVEYNLETETGKYYRVSGSSPAKIEARPGVLTTSSPFSFQGKWAERNKNQYTLHEGFITNCRLPDPWWVLKGERFEIVPGQRAIARNAMFRLRGLPLFYTPYFYKSLARAPRKSGLLTPNLGNSSRRGFMLGGGYYWAISRSYDATYRAQLFTARGLAHHVEFRGKPTQRSDFFFNLYGVNDRGLQLPGQQERRKEGGFLMSVNGRAQLPAGFFARGEFNYLSSYRFRQAFTESFFEAIFTEVHSTAFVRREWSNLSLTGAFSRIENFQSAEPGDTIVVRRAPSFELVSRSWQIRERAIPVWVSLGGSAGFVRRNQKAFQTRQFVDRLDFEPRIHAALRWKEFHLIPSVAVRTTHYGSSFGAAPAPQLLEEGPPLVSGAGLLRQGREFGVELRLPSLERIFDAPAWMGEKVKHVIEGSASLRLVDGVGRDFRRIVRFDEMDLLADTSQLEVRVINRLYAKRQGGHVEEILTWDVAQQRYFDPTFGGALASGQRNVFLTTSLLSGFAFLDQPRRYSPVVSALRLAPLPRFGLEWRSDYDPLRGRMINSGLMADTRISRFTISAGHNQVNSSDVLSPRANQFRMLVGVGQDNRQGWSAAFTSVYDFDRRIMQFATTQVSWNADCCGFSVQYRRFAVGARNENQFRVAFAVANIGSFGTLKRQERIF